ncbi:MAG: cysteine--tRNA ligase [Gammaproteobacteria bacterium]
MLHIYNSLTKQKELFKPTRPNQVNLYVCGSTVYDLCHIGHARSIMVVFDMVTRYLRSSGYQVHYVRNITDIDDKIIQRALENQEPMTALTERCINSLHEDEANLGVKSPDQEPRATHYIPQIIEFIEQLISKDHAYIGEDGDVNFAVNSFADYGKFAHQTLEKLKSGARISIMETKRDPLDFVLWKLAKPNEPSWDSPWGKGRPGWHIECSAMCHSCLGEPIDIHGGGLDLVFPHHQNEIAQSEAAYGAPFVKTWMHVGYVQINQEKMSKSLGNFFTIRDLLERYHPEALRYFLLASHYRSPINYSAENLENAEAALERLYISIRGLPAVAAAGGEGYIQRFNAAMDDDFNTPEAFAVLFDLSREINRIRDETPKVAAILAAVLKQLASIFGILQVDPYVFLQAGVNPEEAQAIEQLIHERNVARKEKKWSEADRLRAALLERGVELEDTAAGTHWRKI